MSDKRRQCDIETDEWLSRFKWDYKKVQAKAHQRIERNHAFIEEDNKYVTTPFGRELINPEYVERFEETKKLKEKINTYSGDRDFAEMEALRIKKNAESNGQDFIERAKDEVRKMEGHDIVDSTPKPQPTIIQPKPRSLWSKFIGLFGTKGKAHRSYSVHEMTSWGKDD